MTTSTDGLKITRVRITNYRGIATLDEEIPATGKIAKGRSMSGKTSFLRAIQAALGANDIKPDAVRRDASKAEVIVDLGDISVKRAIGRSTRSTLDVTKDGGKAKMSSPQTFLTELIGNAAIDPLELMLAKPAERKAQILAALPVEVTETRLRQWAPALPTGFSCDGHGLDVVARAHKYFYDLRRDANADAKSKNTEAERLAGLVLPILATVPIADARAAAAQAAAKVATLEAAEKQAASAAERMASARQRVETLRARAAEDDAKATELYVTAEQINAGLAATDAARADVVAAEQALVDAKARLVAAEAAAAALVARGKSAADLAASAQSSRTTADELAGALGDVAPFSADDLAAARSADAAAKLAVEQAEEGERRAAARKAHEAAADIAKQAAKVASDLDATVKRLDEAPAELLSESNGIPGLSLLDDDLALDGTRLSKLSGYEQMKLCVAIAKRLCAKSKILIVDGLERIDADARAEFLTEVTRDGWQLIGSLVERGDMGLVAVEAAAAASTAAAELVMGAPSDIVTADALALAAADALRWAALAAGIDLATYDPADEEREAA